MKPITPTMHGYLDYLTVVVFLAAPKLLGLDGLAKPSAKAPISGPQAPAPEFADNEPASRFQHAGHFRDGALGAGHEAERCNRENSIERRIREGQRLGPSLDKAQLKALNLCPPPCGGDHRGVRV